MNNNQGRRRTRRVRQQRKQKNTQISRILLTICMMALVAVVSIGGTMAWLAAQTETITNTFTASDIKITIKETANTENDTWEAQIIPGKVYPKDPKVTVTKDTTVDVYLFAEAVETGNPTNYLTYTYALDSAEGWAPLNVEGKKVWYHIVTAEEAKAEPSWYLLTGDTDNPNGIVTVNKTVTKEAAKEANATISFKAYAIQTHGFDTPDKAWKEASDAKYQPTNP